MQIGIIGLGRMGGNIARRLMKAGHQCIVFDANAKPRDELAEEGATAVGSLEKMVNALVKANKLITSSSGEELARLVPKEISGDPKLYAESFEHAREAFPPDSLVSREGVARVIETMRAFDAVPAGMKMEPESVYDNRFVPNALGS